MMKSRGGFSREIAASVLLEALYTTDDIACAKYGISIRTLRRYRQRQAADPELASLILQKKALLDAQWADVLPGAMREAAKTIAEISENIRTDPVMRKNPFALSQLAGALKLCAEVYYTGKLIDDRINRKDRPETQLLGEGTAETPVEYPN